jgi:hypothetical protein
MPRWAGGNKEPTPSSSRKPCPGPSQNTLTNQKVPSLNLSHVSLPHVSISHISLPHIRVPLVSLSLKLQEWLNSN